MTQPEAQPEHCGHECVCGNYEDYNKIYDWNNCPCKNNSGDSTVYARCEHDTRKNDTPKNPCTENGCTDIENCDEICKHQRIYSQAEMDQQIKAERERVLEKLRVAIGNRSWIDSDDDLHEGALTMEEIEESLRGKP